jgi:hypothetical protein
MFVARYAAVRCVEVPLLRLRDVRKRVNFLSIARHFPGKCLGLRANEAPCSLVSRNENPCRSALTGLLVVARVLRERHFKTDARIVHPGCDFSPVTFLKMHQTISFHGLERA